MKYKHGFTLGKFLPPHIGHTYLIDEAKSYVEHLTVLVCTLRDEPINGKLRYEWLKEIYKHDEGINIVHVAEEVPQSPSEHPYFWHIWVDLIDRHVPEKEVFFSSELYGEDVAKHLGIESICIDLKREIFPVSGTMVRNNPFEMWEYIPEVVKPYFVKRVVLTGPESVGKSTLIKKLTAHYQTNHVDEYGRTYCEKYKPAQLYPVDFVHIANKQIENEDQAAKTSNKILFCDTDPIVTEVYSKMYSGNCPEEIIKINKTRKYDLHLLLDIDLPFDHDGTRIYLNETRRQQHMNMFKSTLTEYGANYHIVNGVGEERFNNAIEIIKKYLR